MVTEKRFLLALTLFLAVIVFLMIMPFLGYIIMAMIFAYILKPLESRIETFTGKNIATTLTLIVFVLALLLPFLIALGVIAEDATQLLENLDEEETLTLTPIEEFIEELTGEEIDLQETLNEALDQFIDITIGQITELVDQITQFALGIFILFFVLFYLLKDGEKLYKWAGNNMPLTENTQNRLSNKLDLMTKSVLKGHVLVAIIEGIIGGIGLALAGVPNPVFWTFIMVILSFIPVIGAFLVWGPASIYLVIIGEPLSAIFLALYGTIIIGLADNILRPYLVDKRADIHPAAILVGVIGGLYLFGAIGLIIGPILFGLAKTITETLTLKPKTQ